MIILEVLAFLLKTAIVLGAIYGVYYVWAHFKQIAAYAHLVPRSRYLNSTLLATARSLKQQLYGKDKDKEQEKEPEPDADRPKMFVINFRGDSSATQVDSLKQEITAVLGAARPDKDSVCLKLHSPGGTVTGYGLAAAQLERLRKAKVDLTVCVDEVAASGGYMMAAVANKIISAPFATIGSIGVVVEMPNYHKLLETLGVNFIVSTAGESKRTVTPWTEVTVEKEAKLKKKLEEIHVMFKNHIAKFRPDLDLSVVATGDTWPGSTAQELKLVDEVMTSEEFLLSKVETHDVYTIEVPSHHHKSRIGATVSELIDVVAEKMIQANLRM